MDDEIPVIPGDDALDSEYAARARPAVERVVASGGRRIVFDLAACTFIDRVGIAVLLYGVLSVTKEGGRAAIVVGDRHVRETLALLGFDEIPGVSYYPTVPDALGALGGA